jgi:hypothetical protein
VFEEAPRRGAGTLPDSRHKMNAPSRSQLPNAHGYRGDPRTKKLRIEAVMDKVSSGNLNGWVAGSAQRCDASEASRVRTSLTKPAAFGAAGFFLPQSAYLNSGSAFKESFVAPGSIIFLSRTWREL